MAAKSISITPTSKTLGGGIAVIAPASAKGDAYGFPQDREEYTMGPGLRIIETNVPIYNGPIGDTYILDGDGGLSAPGSLPI